MRRMLVLLTLALLLVPAALARADAAYERVAAAYAESGGHLDACAFTQQQLEAGLAGIPPQIKDVVPDLRKAIQDGIAAHARGECEGREPGTTTNPDAPVSSGGAVPPVTTTPAPTTPPATGTGTEPAQTAPAATTPGVPGDTAAAPVQPESGAGGGVGPRDDARDALVIALVALGALLLLALAIWGWARLRGWDPGWVTRTRHAWGEAGFRTTTTWSEFTDWLRLGR